MPEGPPAEITALIDAVLSGFNSKNAALYTSAFGDDVVIIDGFAPFRWSGPDAPARWWADAETWAQAGGVEHEHLSSQGILYWEVRGPRAYAVVSATLPILLTHLGRRRPDDRACVTCLSVSPAAECQSAALAGPRRHFPLMAIEIRTRDGTIALVNLDTQIESLELQAAPAGGGL